MTREPVAFAAAAAAWITVAVVVILSWPGW